MGLHEHIAQPNRADPKDGDSLNFRSGKLDRGMIRNAQAITRDQNGGFPCQISGQRIAGVGRGHKTLGVHVAEVALLHRDEGVVGFDIAGSESGNPPSRHLDAFRIVAQANSHITIHAGEAFGLPSIWEALQICGAERLGHGVRIVDDITVDDDGQVSLGRLAAYVRDRRVPLEMCPTSNVNTGVCDTIADHPIGLLRRLRFRVTVNTDNRLMSDTSMTNEMAQLHEAFGWGWDDFEWLTINAMKSSFWPFDRRLRIIDEQIKPGYAALKAASLGSSSALR